MRALPTSELRRELLIRFIFSALVDADRLDTEHTFDLGRAGEGSPTLGVLWQKFAGRQKQRLEEPGPTSRESGAREVTRCTGPRASSPPGIYRLTVPTGGGKTLSGLAFGLRHALLHRLRRISGYPIHQHH